MLIIAKTLEEVLARGKPVVGFFGAPPRERLDAAARKYDAKLLDLDVELGASRSRTIPDAYCHIIRNCVDNAVALKEHLVHLVAATGKEKCDAGRYAAWLIGNVTGASVEMTETEDQDVPNPPVLSEARGPLKDRVVEIMRGIAEPMSEARRREAEAATCEATHGFWGTPPNPIGLLELFPDTTHIFGWTRCVEQGRPADLALETTVPEELPIVFFSQGFCPKAQLARHLAEKHRGMHVDVHDVVNAATRAKIEAFIRLATRLAHKEGVL